MHQVWELYEEMDEIVYAADMDTYEILYMNRKARQRWGVRSLEELRGKKCYEVMQNSSGPCALCTNGKLAVGRFEEWQYVDPVRGNHFLVKDTCLEAEGRRCRMGMVIDCGPPEAQQDPDGLIQTHIDAETIINGGLRMSLSTTDVEQSIPILMEYVGMALECDRIYIFERGEGDTFSNTYEWCAKGVTPQIDNLQNLSGEAFELWGSYFARNQNVLIKDLETTRQYDPMMFDILKPQDIHSLVVSPLQFNNQLLGFYGVDNPPGHLLESISTLFMILGHFTVSLLRRRDMHRQLVHLGLYDELTGLGNRHQLDRFLVTIHPESSMGVVNCDVTGLKRVNDTQGHREGDALLVRAADCLKAAFPDSAHFRIGGDEFLVLCPGVTRQVLEERVAHLRRLMQERSAPMAAGAVWSQTTGETLNALLAEADKRMYEEKRKHYAQRSS
jgi:diguanylate cyclase (GGDEF)-like protein